MSVVSEFKEFITKGNVLDLAVGVIIGAAFGKIVSSLTDHIIMPVVGLALGGVDFSTIVLGPMKIGLFLNAVINFLIIAFIVFLIVKGANSVKKAPVVVVVDPGPTKDQVLLMEIRDALRAGGRLMFLSLNFRQYCAAHLRRTNSSLRRLPRCFCLYLSASTLFAA